MTNLANMSKKALAQRILIVPFSIICLLLVIVLISNVSSTYWIIGLVWTAAWLLGFGYAYYRRWAPSWPDEVEFRNGKFCEAFEEESVIKQPINTWSNLGFVAAGLLILLIAGAQASPAVNPMADPDSPVPLVYGLVVIFLGPGSMFFHGSGKKWAGWFDTMSMVAWVGYSLSYTATRLLMHWFGWQMSILWILAGLIIGFIGVITAIRGIRNFRAFKAQGEAVEQHEHGLDETIIVAGAWLVVEALVIVLTLLGSPPGFSRSISWLIGALIAYAAAFVCWLPSTGEIEIFGIRKLWCNPESPYQGHGFWHLFSAIGALLVYLYFASEIPI